MADLYAGVAQGRIQEFVQGGLKFFSLSRERGAQHPLWSENPLKSTDFTGPGESQIR